MPRRVWSAPAWMRDWWAEVRHLSTSIWDFWKIHPRTALIGGVLAVAVIGTLIWPNDDAWLIRMDAGRRLPEDRPWYKLSAALGKYGEFGCWNLALFSGLLAASRIRRCSALRRLATASLLGAAFSGLAVNVVRFSLGRPRPHVDVADGFYGPTFRGKFHAFPSGHSATASGCAVPLLVACPLVGVPTAVVAGSIAWARMRANQHHPSDIAASVIVASVFGIPLGLTLRRLRKKGADAT